MRFTALIFAVALVLSQGKLLHSVESTRGWESKTRSAAHELVFMSFSVKQNNLDVIDALFWEVSNPKSEMYGQFLSFEEVGELIQNEESTQAVIDYLTANKAVEIERTPFGEFVTASLPVHIAETVFQTEFFNFAHESYGEEFIVRSTSYVIPEELAQHITHVDHMTYFPAPAGSGPVISSPDAQGTVSPADIAKYYGIDNTVATGRATQSIFAALGQSYSDSDLASFQSSYNLQSKGMSVVIGSNQPGICAISPNSCGEANLDVQYIMGLAQNIDTTFWRIGRFTANPFVDWTNQMDSYSDIPLVHSISYGGPEYSDSSLTAFNTEMQKFGLRGISVMIASGDDGAVSSQVRSSKSYCAYAPSFPASSPFVTSVGATQGPEDGNEEVACASNTGGLITTGGGFSTVFDVPAYQKDATANYLSTVSPQPVSGYNAGGRGIPDVSFLGHNYNVVIGGSVIPVSGTSASSPSFAAVISLINDARLAAGKSALGFLNQALYSLDSSVWNDITSGHNRCAAGNGFTQNCCSQGFTATTGWDPLTGLGTPRYENLLNALMAL